MYKRQEFHLTHPDRAAGVLELPLARDGQRVAFGSVPFDIVLDLQRVGERLEGTCFHNAVDFPVSFAPGLAPPAVHAARPQTPAPPFPYETETVTFTGRVVSVDHGCGGHSDVVASERGVRLPDPVLDTITIDQSLFD